MTVSTGRQERIGINKKLVASLKEKSDRQKIQTGGRPPVYTDEEVKYVLEKFEKNKLNVRKTSAQTGVNGKTIKIWHTRYILEVSQRQAAQELAENTKDLSIVQLREDYEREVINSKMILLKRIVENLADCKDNRTLLSTLVKINESTNTEGVKSVPVKANIPAKEGSILGVIAQQATINNNINGSENNRAGGDSEKPAG